MAKTTLKRSDPPPSTPRPPSAPSPSLLLGYRILKVLAFVVALPSAFVCLMAAIGALTDNGWARAGGAVAVVLIVPLAIADRLLPEHDPRRARGLVTDVFSVIWALIVFGFAGLAGGATRGLLQSEGDRLIENGHEKLALLAFTLGGVKLDDSAAAAPIPSGSASAGASASASSATGPADAGAALATDAGALDAGAPKPKPADKGDKTPAEIFKELSPSVVTVFVKKAGGEGSGTGFLIDKDGTLATNHHVIEGAAKVRVKFQSGAVYEEVELLVDESTADLALLKVDLDKPIDGGKVDAAPLTLGDSEAIVVGERAVSIGNPIGLEHTLTDGLVSSRRLYEGKAWIQFSAPISPGNSGGPLFNMKGEVIGVTTATLSGFMHGPAIPQNINLAVPINELKKLIHPPYPSRRKVGDATGPTHW